MYRNQTKEVRIGDVVIGGDHPIAIQSMTNTRTEDVEATVEQILRLEKAGCEIIRNISKILLGIFFRLFSLCGKFLFIHMNRKTLMFHVDRILDRNTDRTFIQCLDNCHRTIILDYFNCYLFCSEAFYF